MDSQFFLQEFLGNTVKEYTLFAGIIAAGLLLKRIVSRGLSHLLFRVLKKVANNSEQDAFIALLLKPIERFIFVVTLYLAVNQLSYPLRLSFFTYHKMVDKVSIPVTVTYGDFLDKIFLFTIILCFFWIMLRIIDFIAHVFVMRAQATASREDNQLVPFLKELVKALIYFIGFFVLLGYVFEVNVLTLITGLGISGIAIALAAKETIENLLGSFTIFIDKPFTVGDNVKVKGVEGTVEKVGFRSTLIRTSAKTMATIPNKGMIDGVLENTSQRNFRKVKFTLSLVYSTSIDELKKIISEINTYLEENEHTSDDGIAYLEGYYESAIKIEILYFVTILAYNDYLKIKEEINFKIREIIEANGSGFVHAAPSSPSDASGGMETPQV